MTVERRIRTVGRHNPSAFLASVLQREESIIRQDCGVWMSEDGENAALVAGFMVLHVGQAEGESSGGLSPVKWSPSTLRRSSPTRRSNVKEIRRMESHRAHDYAFLIKRWRAVARTANLRLERLKHDGVQPLFFLRTPALQSEGGIYISAAIHGDEPASSEGLVAWAEENVPRLKSLPVILFPCLNPWGLVNNSRANADGIDLNRVFHLDSAPVILGLKRLIAPYRFSLALTLHEDFDGQGLYLYEIVGDRPALGESLLNSARRVIPTEGRTKIDGRKAASGLIRRRIDLKLFEKMGYPEAIWLHLHHAAHVLTVETPSEFALSERIAAHKLVIEECVRRVLDTAPAPPGTKGDPGSSDAPLPRT